MTDEPDMDFIVAEGRRWLVTQNRLRCPTCRMPHDHGKPCSASRWRTFYRDRGVPTPKRVLRATPTEELLDELEHMSEIGTVRPLRWRPKKYQIETHRRVREELLRRVAEAE